VRSTREAECSRLGLILTAEGMRRRSTVQAGTRCPTFTRRPRVAAWSFATAAGGPRRRRP
jgi:hypothetical protein